MARHDDVPQLCDAHDDLFEAAPSGMPEFFAKRRQVAKFESELRESGDLEPAHVTTLPPDELGAVNGRWCDEIAPA
jgi:hypothetical protein